MLVVEAPSKELEKVWLPITARFMPTPISMKNKGPLTKRPFQEVQYQNRPGAIIIYQDSQCTPLSSFCSFFFFSGTTLQPDSKFFLI